SVRSLVQARAMKRMDSKVHCAMTGSMTLSWSWPASAAMETVTSLPETLKQIWLTTSWITALTFAGMIEDPAWRGGMLISPRPARGPEDSRRRSLQILDSFIAVRFTAAWVLTNAPVSLVASTRSYAEVISRPVISRRASIAASQ